MANKKGHWYTDKNGNHYFVEEGQTPQEGWEASKRRKMISGGKYKVSEDGNEYKDVTEDEYNKYEADETDFDETNEDDFGFDEDDEVMEYLENYDYTGNETLEDVVALAREYDPNITQRDAEIMAQKILESGKVGNDFYSPDNITKRHQKIEDAFEMPKEEGWKPSDFGEKSFIKNKDKDNEMFIQYNGADYDGDNQEWVAGYMKDGEYVNKKFASMEEAKEFLDNADQGENAKTYKSVNSDDTYTEDYIRDQIEGMDRTEAFSIMTRLGINEDDAKEIWDKMNNKEEKETMNNNSQPYKSKYKSEDYEDARYYPVTEEDRKNASPRYLGRYHSIFDAAGLDDKDPAAWKKERDMFKYVGDSENGSSIVQGPDGYFSGNPRINSMSFKTMEQARDYLDRKNPEEHKYGVYFKPGDEREYMYRDAEDKYDLEAPDAYRNAREAAKAKELDSGTLEFIDSVAKKNSVNTEDYEKLKKSLAEAFKEILKRQGK